MAYPLRLIAAAIVLNVLAMVTAYLSVEQRRVHYEETAATATRNLSKLLVQDLGASFESTDEAMQVVADEFARQMAAGKLDGAWLNTLIARQLSRHPDIVAMRVANSQGEAIFGNGGAQKAGHFDVSDRGYFIRHRSDPSLGLVISEPLVGKASGKWGLVFSRRLNHADGSFAGVVLAHLSLDLIETRFARLNLGQDGFIALRDGKLDLIVRFPPHSGPTGKPERQDALRRAWQRQPEGGTYSDAHAPVEGISMIASYLKHEQYPFYVVVGVGKDEYLSGWRSDARKIAAAILVLMFLSTAAVWSLLRSWHRREQAMGELAKSEQSFREIFDAMNDAVFIHEVETGRIIDVNHRMRELFGYEREEMLMPDPGPLSLGEGTDSRQRALEKIHQAATEGPQTFEWLSSTKKGQLFWTEVSLRLAQIGDHQRVVAVVRDISERKAALVRLEHMVQERTQELQDSTEKLRDTQFAMECVGIGIHWVDAESGRYLYTNRYAADLVGYTVDEFLRLSVPDVNPDIGYERFRELSGKIRQRGHFHSESVQKARDGRLIPVEISVYFMAGKKGAPNRLISFLTDISRRKEVEAALVKAKEAAEAANVAKSAFLANMSHEIRTPLNAITGMAYLIRSSGVSAQQAQRLERIDAASRHLLEIIDAILDLSKIEAEKMTLEEAAVNIGSIAANVASMLHERAQAKNLELVVETETLACHLLGDPTRLQQGLLNYGANAIKFTESGTVTLRIRMQEEFEDSALLRFEVVDTGIGIAADSAARLFTPFQQADNSITRQYGGTGLGLVITRRLAELMGGEAGVSSVPGQGSTFWFTARLKKGLPLEPVESSVSSVPAMEALLKRNFSGQRILLAEDDLLNQEIACALLENTGLLIDVAADGRAAVELVSRSDYRLILMDLQMPGLDGLAATRLIRAMENGKKVPIVAMTANVFVEDRLACEAAGMNDFIPKPVKQQELFAALVRWLPAAQEDGNALAPSA